MKKVLKSAILFAFVGGLFVTTGCEEEATVTDNPSYATISGKANCDIDWSDSETNGDNVPDGTVINATVDPSTYQNNTDNSVNYENVVYSTTVSNGTYSFDSVAVYTNEITLNLSFSDFRTDYTDFGGDKVEGAIYSAADQQISVGAGETQLLDVIWQ